MTNLAVVVDGICLFTRVTGAGLEGMAIELAERRSLTLEDARDCLRHVGFDPDFFDTDRDPEIIAEARKILVDGTRRLASEVRASLESHRTQAVSDGADAERAVLTSAAVAVPGFAEALAAELGIPVETRSVSSTTGVAEDSQLAGMTVAAGLAVAEVPSSRARSRAGLPP